MDAYGGTAAAEGDGRRRLLRWGRIAITVGTVAYLASRVDPGEVLSAWKRLSLGSALGALAAVFLGLTLGVIRWRMLLHAYGAPRVPSFVRLGHLYLVGHFYNTYAPGGVGGDVLRGVASRRAFGESSWASGTTGVAVVFIERVLGVSALLALAAGAYLYQPLPGLEKVELWAALGLAAGVVAIGGIAIAPRLAPFLPAALEKPIAALPRLRSWTPFIGAIAASLIIHALNVVAGHAIMHSLDPSVNLIESAVAMPLIGASAFFPLTVGGAGVREAAFAALYGTVGVPEATAYAGSLSFWACQLISAGVGGIINLWVPISGGPDDPTGPQ
ncbi:MAG: lysylphosphatidylglycerol synthase transmembrane domain-containing protein [Myxococcota bacterium]